MQFGVPLIGVGGRDTMGRCPHTSARSLALSPRRLAPGAWRLEKRPRNEVDGGEWQPRQAFLGPRIGPSFHLERPVVPDEPPGTESDEEDQTAERLLSGVQSTLLERDSLGVSVSFYARIGQTIRALTCEQCQRFWGTAPRRAPSGRVRLVATGVSWPSYRCLANER